MSLREPTFGHFTAARDGDAHPLGHEVLGTAPPAHDRRDEPRRQLREHEAAPSSACATRSSRHAPHTAPRRSTRFETFDRRANL